MRLLYGMPRGTALPHDPWEKRLARSCASDRRPVATLALVLAERPDRCLAMGIAMHLIGGRNSRYSN